MWGKPDFADPCALSVQLSKQKIKHFCCVTFQLMDMGFSREHALEALLNTSTMEQATEYLLTHPPPLGGAVRVRINTENIHPFHNSFVILG